MRTLLRLLIAATLAVAAAGAAPLTAAPAVAQPASNSQGLDRELDSDQLDAFVQDRMAATRTPGLAYAVIDAGGVRHQQAWGHDGSGATVNAGTPFLWGSVAKPVTATAIMTLVEAGQLGLDDPVTHHLPEFALADPAATDELTIGHLLTQTSGIPEGTGVTDRFDEDVDDPYRAAVAELADVAPLAPPGEHHEYTSANYLVLGAVVEAVAGQPYADYLQQTVLEPLGMTGALATPAQARASLPAGHRYVFGRPTAMTSPYDPTGASYGYLGGSLTDLARFAHAMLGAGEAEVVTDEALDHMHSGTAEVAERHTYGLGWRDLRTVEGARLVWHGGATPGYQAMVVLLPEHGQAVVMLQNVYGVFQDSALASTGLGVARLLAGEQPAEPGTDPTYPLLLTVLGAASAGLLAAVGSAGYRLWRPCRTPISRRRAAVGAALWTMLGLGVAGGAGWVLPAAFQTQLRVVPLFAPDLAAGLWLLVVAGLILVPLRWSITLRRRR